MIKYKQLTEYLIPAPPGLLTKWPCGSFDKMACRIELKTKGKRKSEHTGFYTWCVCTMKRNVHSLAASRLLHHPFLIYIYLTTKAN